MTLISSGYKAPPDIVVSMRTLHQARRWDDLPVRALGVPPFDGAAGSTRGYGESLVPGDPVAALVRVVRSPVPWLALVLGGGGAGVAMVGRPTSIWVMLGALVAVGAGAVVWASWWRGARSAIAAAQVQRRDDRDMREVESIRSAFLSGVSHELRTPLTTIIGYGETVQTHMDKIEPAHLAHLTDRMVANARRLERLVLDLLDLNRIAHVDQPARVITRIDMLIDEVIGDLPGPPIGITVDALNHPLSIVAAPTRRIVRELVHNAVRHSPPGTPVRITATVSPDGLELTVEDEGPGIDTQMQSAVFSPFVQGREAAASHSPGLGIGLALVRRYVERQGGQVSLESTLGTGTRVRVLLPCEAPARSDAA